MTNLPFFQPPTKSTPQATVMETRTTSDPSPVIKNLRLFTEVSGTTYLLKGNLVYNPCGLCDIDCIVIVKSPFGSWFRPQESDIPSEVKAQLRQAAYKQADQQFPGLIQMYTIDL
jgi:hypothetical protein